MGFNRRNRDPFGPRFGELMGKHCHAAITAASRKNKTEYDRLVADIYQMLDSVEQETEWPNDAPTVQPAPVAAEAEPSVPSTGTGTADPEGAAAPKRAGGKVASTNKRKKRTASPKRPGVGDKPDTK